MKIIIISLRLWVYSLVVGAVSMAEPSESTGKRPKLGFVVLSNEAIKHRMAEIMSIPFFPLTIHHNCGDDLNGLASFLHKSKRSFSKFKKGMQIVCGYVSKFF